MDIKKIEFYEKITDAIEVKTELESVLRILRSKTRNGVFSLEKKECEELGVEQSGLISAVLSYYKAEIISVILSHNKNYEKQKTP